jgi:hypothetical protein
MAEIAFITLVGELLLPLAQLAWLWRGACRSRCEWLLQALSYAAYLALIAVAGVWLLLPWYLPYAFGALGLAAAAASWRRVGRRAPIAQGRIQAGLRIAAHLGLTAFCAGMLLWAFSGYAPPEGLSVSLASPLRGGTFYVVNGGYSILINPHMKTLGRESLSAYRAQSYALDFVRLDFLGRRAQGLWPADLGRYRIFGEPVYAPCEGGVAQIENQLPDQTPPEIDPGHPAGNFVRLECGEADVVLAHLMHASVTVRLGDRVQAGRVVGRVGNSGWSTEPHLHLHAQLRTPSSGLLDGEPVSAWVDGRVLVRNSRLSSSD